MLEPKGRSMRSLLSQAVGSVKFLADQRDLHQIALMQWVTGKFTLADSFLDDGVNHEMWLYLHHDDERRDIVVEIARTPQGTVMQAHWANEVIQIASRATHDTTCVRWAGVVLTYRDRRRA
jgi:hypothetical protein